VKIDMQISYDKKADAIAIWFEGIESVKTIDATDDIFIDFDKNDRLACIEIINASEKLNPEDLLNISVILLNDRNTIEWIPCRPTTFGNGHLKPDSHYSIFKDAIRNRMQKIHIPGDSQVKIEAEVYLDQKRYIKGRNDIDNFLKGIIDALNEANCFEYEQQIDEINIKRVIVNSPEEEGVKIALIELKNRSSVVQMTSSSPK
jgi:Holliday junction resolvase RusA-like endonuclease/uncharacterized protein YuzE